MTLRWYLLAILLAAGSAALVFWQLDSSSATECFRSSLHAAAADEELPETCDSDPFKTVRTQLEAQRASPAAADPTSELEGKAALIVWMTLFAATAGLAALVGVRSSSIIRELAPTRIARFMVGTLVAGVVVATPFVLFAFLPVDLSPFDDLHLAQIRWMSPMIGALMLPAVSGLVLIRQIVTTRSGLGLEELARLGSLMQQLVGMAGSVLALAIVTTASRWRAIDTLPGGEAVPSAVILLWGSFFALVLAVLFVPAHQVWAKETEVRISEEVQRQLSAEPARGGTPGFRGAELALSKELRATLGLGGPLKTFQGPLAVLAPVIAAAVSSLFS